MLEKDGRAWRRIGEEDIDKERGCQDDQGKAAAAAILGKREPYAEVPWFWSDQYDLKLQMTGLYRPGDSIVIRGDMAARKFSGLRLSTKRVVIPNLGSV